MDKWGEKVGENCAGACCFLDKQDDAYACSALCWCASASCGVQSDTSAFTISRSRATGTLSSHNC